jgi:hypothetical protein
MIWSRLARRSASRRRPGRGLCRRPGRGLCRRSGGSRRRPCRGGSRRRPGRGPCRRPGRRVSWRRRRRRPGGAG